MITTPEEYFKYLWGIEIQEPSLDENGNPKLDEQGNVIMKTKNPYNNKPLLSFILPSDEKTFDVDLSSRTISVPTFLSVSKDHRAETVYFLVDRFFEYKDLATTSCMIEFINAEGKGGFYPVPFYDISSYPRYFSEDEDGNQVVYEAKMIIPWCIEGDVTAAAGPVQFALRFYELDETKKAFSYNVRTLVATAQVLQGMDAGVIDEANADLEANFATQINEKIDNATATIYWTDLPDTEYRSDFYFVPRYDEQGLDDDGSEIDDYENGLENAEPRQ